MDCHDHWHLALDNYDEPDGFRLALNSLVQALRNVTWVLQKQKAELPNFGEWYPAWQGSVGNDPVMKWVVKARNRIVKESDLEIHSRARVRIEADWLNAAEGIYDVPPRWGHAEIVTMLVSKGAGAIPEGEVGVTIERRWVDRMLPERELLDACAEAYEHLRRVIGAAHAAAGVVECDLGARSRPCVDAHVDQPFDCNWFDGDARTLHLDASTLTPYDSRLAPLLPEDYPLPDGIDLTAVRSLKIEGDAIAAAPAIYALGKLFLQSDGAVIPADWFMRDDRIIDIRLLGYTDQIGKRLTMNSVAERVRLLNATGLLILSESWLATAPTEEALMTGEFVPARYRADRLEALNVLAATADGRMRSIVGQFSHEGDEIVFGEATDDDSQGFFPLIMNVLKVWGLDAVHLQSAKENAKRASDSRE